MIPTVPLPGKDVTTSPGGTQDVNIIKVSGTAQTASDWSAHFAFLDATATEVTVGAIRDRLPAALDADGGLKTHVVNQNPSVVQGRLDDAATTPAAEDAAADIRITPQRAAHVNLRDQSGNELLAPKTFTADLTEVGQITELDTNGRASVYHIDRRVGAGSATIALEESPDGANWFGILFRNPGDVNSSWASGNLALGTGFSSLVSPLAGKRFRIRVVSITVGVTAEVRGILMPMRAWEASDYAKQSTLATRASEATLALVKAKTDNLDVALSTRATEATLATRASEATLALVKAKTDNLDVALSSFPKLVKSSATLLASAARTTNGAGTDVDASNFYAAVYFLDVTAVSGTAPTLDASIEAQDPASLKWMSIADFPQMTAVGGKVLRVVGAIGAKNRVSWTIGGTSPSFTFGVGVVHER